MMTQTGSKYAAALWDLNVSVDTLKAALEIYQSEPELQQVLVNPTIYKEKKHAVVERIFPKEIHNFLKILCDYNEMEYFPEITEDYENYVNEHNQALKATLYFVTAPKDHQVKGFEEFLKKEFRVQQVQLALVQDNSLLGGFILSAEDREWDWSTRRRISSLKEKFNRR